MTRIIYCVKLKQESPSLRIPPYPGSLGTRIYNEVSEIAWKQWLELQKMLINEKRLNLADAQDRKYLVTQMEAHFFGTGAEQAEGFIPR